MCDFYANFVSENTIMEKLKKINHFFFAQGDDKIINPVRYLQVCRTSRDKPVKIYFIFTYSTVPF